MFTRSPDEGLDKSCFGLALWHVLTKGGPGPTFAFERFMSAQHSSCLKLLCVFY